MNKYLKVYGTKRMLSTLLLGFSGGLPLMLATSTTIQARMKDANIDIATIGFFGLVGLPYALKFMWAPLMDALPLPFLGLRRGWLVVSQMGLIASTIGLALADPASRMDLVALMAFLVSFCSATQDIVIDAYRIEILNGEEELGAGAGTYVTGYRLAMLFSGGFALVMADHMSWTNVYLVMAAVQSVGMITVLLSPEPKSTRVVRGFDFKKAVVEPFVDFFQRSGAMEILLFIMIYKLSTLMATALTTAFLKEIGFSNTVIGLINKSAGITGTIVGTLTGGLLMVKFPVKRALWVFGVVQALVGPTFCILSAMSPDTPFREVWLVVVVFTDNFMMGLGTAALTGFMMNFTNKKFTVTQYALLTSVLAVARVILISQAGVIVREIGWNWFFILTVPLAIPGLLLLFQYDTWQKDAGRATNQVSIFTLAQIALFLPALLVLISPPIWIYFDMKDAASFAEKAGAVAILIVVMSGVLKPLFTRRLGAGASS